MSTEAMSKGERSEESQGDAVPVLKENVPLLGGQLLSNLVLVMLASWCGTIL